MKYPTLFALAAVSVACGDGLPSNEPDDGPAFDGNAPRVHIVSPARGTFAGDVTFVLVTGTVHDDSGSVASLTVNGVPATITGGTWLAKVPVAPGTNLLHAIAIDDRHNQGAETRAVVAGPTVALDGRVTDGIHASLSAQALSALGRDTATLIEAGGLMTAVQSMNPVVDVGGGPNCLYANASITSLTVGDADVQMRPTTGGIAVSAVLDNVSIGTHLQWAVACLDDSRDVVQSAQRVTVQGLLTVGVVDGKLDIQFDNPNVQVTGFDPHLPDAVPANIVQTLDLDTATSVALGLVTERVVVPMVDRSLAALDVTKTLDVAGLQIDVDVQPTKVSFTSDGGTIALDTSFHAHGENNWFVFVPNAAPSLDMKSGFALAVADDAANQLLASMWSAGGFDATIDLRAASNGPISESYDSVQLHLAVPPFVEASGSPLELTIGDWIATFTRGHGVTATVAIHAKSALYAVTADDGTLRMGVSTPAVDIDVVDGGALITKEQYQAIRKFALAHVQSLSSTALGTIPLPAPGHVALTNPWLDPKAGSLLVIGDVPGGE